ncbi:MULTISPECIES: LysR family transcriptional regulator [Brucella/Ochrobactrum group]|uniref:LysR family transcriptional regulator n=1 Tax=Ochrobactrum chromiisoli TaxID=2993941 RepID=A0ABT3QTX6_9HYPH|nr:MULTISPECIES: LysR family transcriptional regulator [Brucella/Ochrobactrum group]MCX2699064.1 LysR family transcriptional regulator [Ochrobactrum chromiisoli]MDG9793687.1 LysR family transcriptional regulator [Brucella anthropi]MDH0583561.1 LysR family transcriptional regulator [Brucella anthropi]MDH0820098.1 LysR family transcriptional regulator [Brucella anthropi]MDH2086924.1 LysR family transcriptional regulator [Brucella anthropi]
MEMNQIRYFLAVCEHRNFTHAASASNVSQPSLTTAIKKLEGELGAELFVRDRAGCRLTALGKLMRPRLQKIYDETRRAKAEAVRHMRLERVPLSVGVGETIGHSRISAAMERMRKRVPQAEIELIVASSSGLLAALRDGDLDVVVTSDKVSEDLYRIDHLYEEDYRVVVSKSHPLSELKTISLSTLAETDMLDRLNCEMRDTLHGACADHGHELYAAYRSNRVDWLVDLARQGSGAVILPVTAIPSDIGLVSKPIDGLEISRTVWALRYRHQATRAETNDLIREMMRTQA